MQLVIATHNRHKVEEFRERLQAYNVDVLALPQGLPEATESGTSFQENAIQKAMFYSAYTEHVVLSDDSGLEVAALNGEPGIYSARYAGDHGNDRLNNQKLISRLNDLGLSEADASFVCAIALCKQGGIICYVEGRVDGTVHTTPSGANGFGYDPLFSPAGSRRRFAEMTMPEKAAYSHRSAAIAALIEETGRFGVS